MTTNPSTLSSAGRTLKWAVAGLALVITTA
jgi:hypothetical protein